jgi:ribulose-5-phosphate 4-epimerase/fuculose-1-phosphate aldolase
MNKPADTSAKATNASTAAAMGVSAGFNIPDPHEIDRLEGKVSELEWTLRCNLAATYRLCALYGWTDLVFTHISLRLPDEENEKGEMEERFLINPYGVMFEEMTASALVKIDLDGKICQAARHDASCVIHVHTPYGIAVSAQKEGLRRYSQFSMQVQKDLAYHDYEGIALELDERERIVKDLGEKSLLMLRNHGTLTLGPNCAIAFLRMYFLENACKAQIFAQSVGGAEHLNEEPQEMGDKVYMQGAAAFMPGMGDNLVWPGLMRKLKRANPGYDH